MLSRMLKTEVHHQFSPPLAKQKENENWQTPAHPLNHYKFYYSPHIIHRLLKAIHDTDIMVIQPNCNIA